MGLPGQVYFAGTHLNPNVTWWPMVGGYIEYMNRIHFMMQQGLPVADVLYYVGENIPAFVRLKRDDPAGVLPGYDYDVIDTQSLIERLEVNEDGYLTLPDGVSYRVLALPAHDAYDLPTLEKVAQLVDAGAVVCGRRPERRYSRAGDVAADRRFAELVARLWEGGKVSEKTTREVLADSDVAVDFTYTEAEPVESAEHRLTIDYIHRRTDSADVYFVANRLNVPRNITASFRQAGRQPELWNPITGEIISDAAFRTEAGRTNIALAFAPEGSVLVVFQKPIGSARPRKANIAKTRQLSTIAGPWTVTFDRPWGPNAPVTFTELIPWNEHDDDAIRFYSGAAAYRTDFTMTRPNGRIFLDLGEVKEVAQVVLNGVTIGDVWATPARTEITSALKSGPNELEVRVANNWPNRMIGDQTLPASQRSTKTNFQKFSKDHPLFPSGLIGPVRVLQWLTP